MHPLRFTACTAALMATSLAETSITINGVTVVIDSGLERRARTDSSTGAQRLETVMASQASATQRAGRAGRTQAGTCYRLPVIDCGMRRGMRGVRVIGKQRFIEPI